VAWGDIPELIVKVGTATIDRRYAGDHRGSALADRDVLGGSAGGSREAEAVGIQSNRLTGPVFGDEEFDVGENTVAICHAVIHLRAGGCVYYDDIIGVPVSSIHADEFTGEVFVLVGVDYGRDIEAAVVVIRGESLGRGAGSGPRDRPG